MIAVGISDSIADVLGRFPGYPGHEVRLAIPPGSALFLTASEFRALKEASDQAGIVTTVETEDPLRRQLARHVWPQYAPRWRPDGPSPCYPTPDRSQSPAQPPHRQSNPARSSPCRPAPLPGASSRSQHNRRSARAWAELHDPLLPARPIVRRPGPDRSRSDRKGDRPRHLPQPRRFPLTTTRRPLRRSSPDDSDHCRGGNRVVAGDVGGTRRCCRDVDNRDRRPRTPAPDGYRSTLRLSSLRATAPRQKARPPSPLNTLPSMSRSKRPLRPPASTRLE